MNKKKPNNWISAEEEKPDNYDLVSILCNNDESKLGWWTGAQWDSGKPLLTGQKVVAWKKNIEKKNDRNQ